MSALSYLEEQAQSILEIIDIGVPDALRLNVEEPRLISVLEEKLADIEEQGMALNWELVLAQMNLLVVAKMLNMNLIVKNTAEELSEVIGDIDSGFADFAELVNAVLDGENSDSSWFDAILRESERSFPFS